MGTWTTFTWEPLHNNLGNLDNLYLENLGTLQGTLKEPWGNLLGTLREPWGTLGTLREPWEPLLGDLGTFTWGPGNLYLGTWEPLLGNLYLGTCTGNLYLEPGNLGGMSFGAAPVCSETFTMAEDPKAFCCWGKMRLEKSLIDCFANDFEKLFKTIANKETCNLFLISPTIVFLPPSLRGVLAQDSIIVMTLNLSGWHLQVRRCVWNRIFFIVFNVNWKPGEKSHEQIHTIYFFLCQQSFSFFPARVATRKINLGVGVLVQDPMIVVMTLNLTGWHLKVRRCVWNRILLIVRNENWTPIKKHHK